MARVRVQLSEQDFDEVNMNDLNDIVEGRRRDPACKRSGPKGGRGGFALCKSDQPIDASPEHSTAPKRPKSAQKKGTESPKRVTKTIKLKPFQEEFLASCRDPKIDLVAMSAPRGSGKSFLCGELVTSLLDPNSELFVPGSECVLISGSIEQCRIIFRYARENLRNSKEYSFLDSATRVGITHRKTKTRLRVVGSNAKTTMGLQGVPFAICDEPSVWETNAGTLMWDALVTAQGKVNSHLKIVIVGTLAPALQGWYHDLIHEGSGPGKYIKFIQGDAKKWDLWNNIRRCNPLIDLDPKFRETLKKERDEAKRDPRLKARFLSYRLNVPSADQTTVLLTIDDYKQIASRELGERDGPPIVGYDVGANRAWSSAVGIFPSGRIECLAIAPGIPTIQEQEARDRVTRGTYQKLVDNGTLQIAEGLRVPKIEQLHSSALATFGSPRKIMCDNHRLESLRDVVKGEFQLVNRRMRWSEGTDDINALRRLSLDGPLSIPDKYKLLLAASLSVTKVKLEEGNIRLLKQNHNTARDDVSAALILAAGEFDRLRKRPTKKSGMKYGGLVG